MRRLSGYTQLGWTGQKPIKRASLMSLSFNIANTVVGAGILSMAYAISCSGLALGLLFLMSMFIFSLFSMFIICEIGEKHDVKSYGEMTSFCLGRQFSFISLGAISVQTFGSCVAYLIICSDFMIDLAILFHGGPFKHSTVFRVLVLFLLTFLLYPLCIQKSMNKLSGVSAISIGCAVACVLLVVLRASSLKVTGDIRLTQRGSRLFLATPIMAVAFGGHYNLFPIFRRSRERDIHEKKKSIARAMLFSLSVYLLMGIVGYLALKQDVHPNVLNNLPPNDAYATLAKLSIAVTIALSFPLVHFSFRSSSSKLIKQGLGKHLVMKATGVNGIYTALTLLLAMTTAIIAGNIGTVFGLVGSTSATMIVLILPGLSYIRVSRNATRTRLAALALLVYGIIVMITGIGASTILTLKQL